MRALRFVAIAVIVAVIAVVRWRRYRGRGERVTRRPPIARARHRQFVTSDVGLVMGRELRERLRSRFYLAGTVFILLVVGAAIVIPVVHHAKTTSETVGVVGTLAPTTRSWLLASAAQQGSHVHLITLSDVSQAKASLSTGKVALAVIDGRELLVASSISTRDTSPAAYIARSLATHLGAQNALTAAHLSAQQVATLTHAVPVPIVALHRGNTRAVNATSLIGVILIFIMLNQYNTWILIGVMEEKSSRVIEVLLSTVRPVRLLAGKVLGIGLAALMQASVVVAFALALSSAIGSNLLHGTGPFEVISTLVWLVLGYALYSWVYAAAGSMAERQDQVQSLVLPLSIPLIVGYVVTLTAASASSPSLLLKIFAYVPLTAPFAMTAMVGFGAVAWWQFAISIAISVLTTMAVARLATGIYRRAILRTGSRVRLRDFRRSP